MIALFLYSALASATELESADPVPWEIDWAANDRESTNVAKVGNGLVAGGLAVAIAAGGSVDSDVGLTVFAAGNTAFLVGPGVVAGGSLRARQSLKEQGVIVNPAAAYTGFGLLGASVGSLLAASAVDPSDQDTLLALTTVGAGCYLGSLIAGNVQLGINRRARQRSGRGRGEVQRRTVDSPNRRK